MQCCVSRHKEHFAVPPGITVMVPDQMTSCTLLGCRPVLSQRSQAPGWRCAPVLALQADAIHGSPSLAAALLSQPTHGNLCMAHGPALQATARSLPLSLCNVSVCGGTACSLWRHSVEGMHQPSRVHTSVRCTLLGCTSRRLPKQHSMHKGTLHPSVWTVGLSLPLFHWQSSVLLLISTVLHCSSTSRGPSCSGRQHG